LFGLNIEIHATIQHDHYSLVPRETNREGD